MVADDNPYRPPREAGYDNPEYAARKRKLKDWLIDRTALVGSAFLVFFVIIAIQMLVLWFRGVFP